MRVCGRFPFSLSRQTPAAKEESEMPKVPAEESQSLLEDGTYEVELLTVADFVIKDPSFGDGNVFKWSFEVVDQLDEDGEPIILDPISNRKLTPLTKFWAWAVALGAKPEIGEDFDTETLNGAHAMAQVEAKLKPDGSKGFPKIVGLVAMPKTNARRPTGGSTKPDSESISDWWAKVRDEGFEQDYVREICLATFRTTDGRGRTVSMLTPAERDELYKKLVGE